jgi:hypothetical protein
MVTKFDKNGHPYREPPYTWEEEQEFYRRFGNGPITVVKGRPPPEHRQKPKPKPGAKRPT